MSRPLRLNIKDGRYHVTSRGNERKNIVRDDSDRKKWLWILGHVAGRRRWRVFAFSLLDNHYHLYLQTPDADLSPGMQEMNAAYAMWFNKRHQRCGHLFQGRFKGILVESAGHDWELTRYVHLNPVRAGLTDDPENFQWGSCRFYFNDRGAPDWLDWQKALGQRGKTLREARKEYRAYLAEGLAARPDRPADQALASTVLGSADFLKKIREIVAELGVDREVPATRALVASYKVASIEAAVSLVFGVDLELIRRRRIRKNHARMAGMSLLRQMTSLSLAEIGHRFGGASPQSVSTALSNWADVCKGDREMERKMEGCKRLIQAGRL